MGGLTLNSEPLVSVIIPFYSEKKWLIESIESVRKQTYKNIEILVINDGSHEDISDISYNNLKIIYKSNGGPASARNMGIKKSKGKYLAFLDSDDIWLPTKLSAQIKKMETNNLKWSQHSYEMFWEESFKRKSVITKQFQGDVLKDCYISFKVQTSCLVVCRETIINNHFFFPEGKRYGQDLGFYKHLAAKYPLGYIDGVHSNFRIRGSNAGFRAAVQLRDKSSTWKEIKNDTQILRMLPKKVIFAYKFSSIISTCINVLVKQFNIGVKMDEIISKIGYFFPYLIFKSEKLKFTRK